MPCGLIWGWGGGSVCVPFLTFESYGRSCFYLVLSLYYCRIAITLQLNDVYIAIQRMAMSLKPYLYVLDRSVFDITGLLAMFLVSSV